MATACRQLDVVVELTLACCRHLTQGYAEWGEGVRWMYGRREKGDRVYESKDKSGVGNESNVRHQTLWDGYTVYPLVAPAPIRMVTLYQVP